MELLDTRFGRSGYPKTINYTENDKPELWAKAWYKRNAENTEYYSKQTKQKITYSLNSQGYREQEWNNIDWNNSFVFIGCSHTFGVGVAYEKTLPKLMQEKLGAYCVNLGIPGGSNYFSMINSAKIINAGIKPKGIFYQHTYPNRWFDFKDGNLNTFSHNDKGYQTYFKNEQYTNFVDDSINQTLHSQWNGICNITKFVIDDLVTDCGNQKYIARCGAHYNDLYFEKAVEELYDKYKQQIEE